MKIDFYLRYRTRFGQNLFIEGNFPSPDPAKELLRLPMLFLNEEWWHLSIELDENTYRSVHYRYVYRDEHGAELPDGEGERILALKNFSPHLVVYDSWVYSGAPELAFYTAPFQNIFLPVQKGPKLKEPKTWTHLFRVKAPLLQHGEVPCVLGSCNPLSNWNTEKPVLMTKSGDWWRQK